MVISFVIMTITTVLKFITDSFLNDILLIGAEISFFVSGVNYIRNRSSYNKQGTHRVLEKYQTKSGCYKAAKPLGEVKGIVIHSTGSNDPYLNRYVEDHNELGYNSAENHWNTPNSDKMPHIFIGYDKDKKVVIVNTVSYGIACWCCGSGSNGSFDAPPNGHIQIQICEDSLEDRDYFRQAVFGAAVQICSSLCQTYNLKVQSITSDKEAFNSGYASNCSNFEDWLAKYKCTMDDFRSAVKTRETSIR